MGVQNGIAEVWLSFMYFAHLLRHSSLAMINRTTLFHAVKPTLDSYIKQFHAAVQSCREFANFVSTVMCFGGDPEFLKEVEQLGIRAGGNPGKSKMSS